MNVPLRARILLIAVLPAIAAVVATSVLHWAVSESRGDAVWVAHTYEVIAQATATESTVLSAQTAVRAYMLGRGADYVQRYRESAQAFAAEESALNTLVADNPAQQKRLSEALALFGEWRDVAERTVAAPPGQQDFLPIGQKRVDALRGIFSQFISEERRLLSERQTASAASSARVQQLVFALTLGLIGVASLLAAVLGLRIARGAQQLAAAAAKMRDGHLDVRAQVTGHDELATTATAFNALAAGLANRQLHERRMKSLRESLQLAVSVQEATEIFERLVAPLVGASGGALFLAKNSRNALVRMTAFGGHPAPETLALEECLAVRGSRPHWSGVDGALACPHLGNALATAVCLPLHAQSEVSGLLVLAFDNAQLAKVQEPVVAEVADVLGLALANLRMREALRGLAFRDPLTGLYNRRYLDDVLGRELARTQRMRRPLTVMMLDIDHFKQINDQHGHGAGDAVLREVGSLLNAFFRGSDIACRYGGEEFIVVLPELGPDVAVQRAEQIRERVANMRVRGEGQGVPRVTISVGVAIDEGGVPSPEELVRAADAALYASKKGGRDRVTLAPERWEPGLV